MKKDKIIVRRSSTPVIIGCIITFCPGLFFVHIAISHRIWTVLFFSIWFFLVASILLTDYFCWKIVFSEDSIQRKGILQKSNYSYSEIQVIKEYKHLISRGNQKEIVIVFYNGDKISILSGYKNYTEARKILLRHASFFHPETSVS